MQKKTWLITAAFLTLSLGGCEWINDLGRHLPVLDEEDRCENWQCFTESGRAASDAKKRGMARRDAAEKEHGRTPVNGAESGSSPTVQAVPAGEVKTREITPFDMTPDQLQGGE